MKREISNFNATKKKEYRTWKYLTLFYICKKCGFMSDFRSNDIRRGGIFSICLVPKDDEFKIDGIKSKKKPSCVYCGFSRFPMNPQEEEITQDNIIKLWIKGKFFGYYCKVHRLAFCKKIDEVNWDNMDENYKQLGGTFNVLGPLNSLLSGYTIKKEYKNKQGEKVRKYELDLTNKSIPKYIISKKGKFDEDRCLLIEHVEFKKIGGFPTASDFSEPLNNFQQVSVMVPQNKMNKFKKWLEKHDCKIA